MDNKTVIHGTQTPMTPQCAPGAKRWY